MRKPLIFVVVTFLVVLIAFAIGTFQGPRIISNIIPPPSPTPTDYPSDKNSYIDDQKYTESRQTYPAWRCTYTDEVIKTILKQYPQATVSHFNKPHKIFIPWKFNLKYPYITLTLDRGVDITIEEPIPPEDRDKSIDSKKPTLNNDNVQHRQFLAISRNTEEKIIPELIQKGYKEDKINSVKYLDTYTFIEHRFALSKSEEIYLIKPSTTGISVQCINTSVPEVKAKVFLLKEFIDEVQKYTPENILILYDVHTDVLRFSIHKLTVSGSNETWGRVNNQWIQIPENQGGIECKELEKYGIGEGIKCFGFEEKTNQYYEKFLEY